MRKLKAKKLLALSLTAAMAMSMAACGGSGADNAAGASNTDVRTTESSVEESTAAETETAAA